MLVGPRVDLIPFHEQCITDDYLSWLNDKNLLRYSKQRLREHDRESCFAYLKSFEGSPNKFWAIRRRSDRLHIGSATAYVDLADRVADVGILIGHCSVRGNGFGREAWGQIMDFLFQVENLRKVTGGTLAANLPMVRIFLHWRMALEGVRREQELVEAIPADVLLFGMLREEWERYFPGPVASESDNLVSPDEKGAV
jgi:RimJ/RimL family protein N-acetyltransferase